MKATPKTSRTATKTESEAIEWLRGKFEAPEFAVLAQVPDGTGGRKLRTADALILSLWPSRGLKFYGIEYKRSRTDWKRELKDVHKAESIGQYCHFWYILAPKGLIPFDEVPPIWGLWEIDNRDRLVRTKPAQEKMTVKPVDITFLAGILRAAANYKVNDSGIHAANREGYRQGYKDGTKTADDHKARYEQRMADVRSFEESSGLSIEKGWSHEQLGEEVREALKMLANPKEFQWKAKQMVENTFRLYRAALASANALGLTDDEIAKQLTTRK